ncbi:hypothetical protein BJ165DRAFT_1614726 [Panaeolus papilionaceus]|nr:hypothetical protein BJ165DRAFT_1614726 [Panaeolus papilionaceus]
MPAPIEYGNEILIPMFDAEAANKLFHINSSQNLATYIVEKHRFIKTAVGSALENKAQELAKSFGYGPIGDLAYFLGLQLYMAYMYFKGVLMGLVATCIAQVAAIDFSTSNYIWTNEGQPPSRQPPPGSRAFRRAAYAPRNKHTKYADILISTDDKYQLFVNEVKIGSGNSFQTSQLYHVPLDRGCNIFAVNATNGGNVPNPAGVLATIKIHYTDGSVETIVTDQTWRAFTSVPAGFETDDFFDGNWPPATIQAPYNARPAYWPAVPLPADAPLY